MPMPKRKPNYNGKTTMEELLTICIFTHVMIFDII